MRPPEGFRRNTKRRFLKNEFLSRKKYVQSAWLGTSGLRSAIFKSVSGLSGQRLRASGSELANQLTWRISGITISETKLQQNYELQGWFSHVGKVGKARVVCQSSCYTNIYLQSVFITNKGFSALRKRKYKSDIGLVFTLPITVTYSLNITTKCTY